MLRVDPGHGAGEPGLDGSEAGEVGQVARVVCSRRGGKDGPEEGKVLSVDRQWVGMQSLVDLLPGGKVRGGIGRVGRGGRNGRQEGGKAEEDVDERK